VKDACARVANWLEFPNVVWLDSTAEDFAKAARLLEIVGTGGNLATDAQIAAIARRVDGSIHSCDHDYARFPEIQWSDPLR
jgi:predicted nucleic acid-binding protein